MSGTLASGLIPAVAPTAPKKELAKRVSSPYISE